MISNTYNFKKLKSLFSNLDKIFLSKSGTKELKNKKYYLDKNKTKLILYKNKMIYWDRMPNENINWQKSSDCHFIPIS